jgi:hypothetical protein
MPSSSLCGRLLMDLSHQARGMERARGHALTSSNDQQRIFSVGEEKDVDIPPVFQDVIKNHAATCRGIPPTTCIVVRIDS